MAFLNVITHRFWLILSLFTCGAIFLNAQANTIKEYQVKAAFLFNFIKFVEWPETAFHEDHEPIIIGVLGEDPFGSYLKDVVIGEKIDDHPIVIQYYKSVKDIKECHILFISLDEVNKLSETISILKDKSVLTVSDASSFIQQGGMIRFITDKKKIRFQINPEAAKSANLTISSKLLRLAEIVVPDRKD